MEFIDLNMVQLLGMVILVFCGGYYVGTRNTEIKWLHRQISKLESQGNEVKSEQSYAMSFNGNGNGLIRKNHEVMEADHTHFTVTPTAIDTPSV